MQYFVGSNAECAKDADCPSSYCQNGFCHSCFDKCCQVDADCTKKGLGYCQNDATKMPRTSAITKTVAQRVSDCVTDMQTGRSRPLCSHKAITVLTLQSNVQCVNH